MNVGANAFKVFHIPAVAAEDTDSPVLLELTSVSCQLLDKMVCKCMADIRLGVANQDKLVVRRLL